jgi:hypothetical protein
VANADPLKAVTLLPASTNTDESASPSLRGSSAERSSVIINGAPVSNPVRFSQLNNIGNFSLLNTAMISHEYVYASNPPLAVGNSTAGVIEIETYSGELKKSSTQASLSLGAAGFMRLQRLHSDDNFVQLYGNYGFGSGVIKLNKKTVDDRLNGYHTMDGGMNLHLKTGEHASLKLYSYVTREKSDYRINMYTWEENAIKEKVRNFNILSFRYQKGRNSLSISHSNDFSRERLQLGNMLYQPRSSRFYTTAGYKRVEDRVTVQLGLSHDYAGQDLHHSRIPLYYYAMSPESPVYPADSLVSQRRSESYVYAKWNISKKIMLSGGARAGLPLSGQSFYLSRQIGLKYHWDSKHSSLLSVGKYHGYAAPNYYNLTFLPQSATHFSLDHEFRSGRTLVQAAIYNKVETGDYTTNYTDLSRKRRIFGCELFVEQGFARHFKLSGSYTYLYSKQQMDGYRFQSANSMPYLVKLSASYQNLRVATLALSYVSRPGLWYTPIAGSEYDPVAKAYRPRYEQAINSERMEAYNRLDFTANKVFFIGDRSLIIYCAVNNILDIRNKRERLYDTGYNSYSYDYYGGRIVYFGFMLNF